MHFSGRKAFSMVRVSRHITAAASLAGLSMLLAFAHASALAQTASRTSLSSEALKLRDQELETLRAQQKKAADAEKNLRLEIERLGADRRQLNQALIDTAAKVRDTEGRLNASEQRLKPLEDREQVLRGSLEGRRAVIAEVLASLQRMGRQPPPALMVRPEDALRSVRSAIMLGAVLPDMRERAKLLSDDLAELVRVRSGIAQEKASLTRELETLDSEQKRMSLLVEGRQKKEAEAQKALDTERAQASILSRQADNVRDLILRMEKDLDPATRAARAALRSDSDKPDRAGLAALKDPGRLTPAMAFASARKLLPMPVSGIKVRDFGASDGLGGSEKGISLTTRAGAQVTSPCDGWVVYAGPFRSYGQLLILNAGGGYHVLLAGMERISVDLGQFVLTGEPVAAMGSVAGTGAQIASSGPVPASQPVLYIEFRKDGVPVDSGPWWVTQEGEKVRG
jgi:septal ring factor EnvC (AmiA/AmiB activator)